MFESLQLCGAYSCVGTLALLGVGFLAASGFRKSGKMALAGAICLLGAGMMLALASWYARKCDEIREVKMNRQQVVE
jgi:hypothetical protein